MPTPQPATSSSAGSPTPAPGDKGNTANVGLIALEPEYYPILVREVTRRRAWPGTSRAW